jgi:hypothetical protein
MEQYSSFASFLGDDEMKVNNFCANKILYVEIGTERSAYFRQIEEDAEKHAAAILEVKDAIGSFQSKDMAELVRFHQHVEQQLVSLTDETQVSFLPLELSHQPSSLLRQSRVFSSFDAPSNCMLRCRCWPGSRASLPRSWRR